MIEPNKIELPGDSWDYELLTEGVRLSKDTQGLTCEIGLRRGGGSKHIIDAIAQYCPGKTHIAIDPYGNIPYEHKEGHIVKLDYTNEMRDECLHNLYAYCYHKKVNFQFYNMSDNFFFGTFKDGVPVYDEVGVEEYYYSFVHFDGPHSFDQVFYECDFFMRRIKPGACFCFDDVNKEDVYYDHQQIDDYLLANGFKLIKWADRKALYQYLP